MSGMSVLIVESCISELVRGEIYRPVVEIRNVGTRNQIICEYQHLYAGRTEEMAYDCDIGEIEADNR